MNRLVLSALLLLAGVAYACGPRGRSAEPEGSRIVTGDSLDAVLEVKVRDGIEFALRVTNHTAAKLELLFPTGQTHDFAVVDLAGREMWRWSEGRMFTQAFMNRILDTNGTLRMGATWRSSVPPGRYTAIATVLSENRPLEERVEFEVK
jgi:hypothetical protein